MSGPPSSRLARFADRMLGVSLVGSGFSIIAIQWGAALGGVAWLADTIRRRERPRLPLLRVHLAFYAASILSCAAAVDRAAAFSELRSTWIPVLLYLAMANRAGTPSRVVTGLRLLLGVGGAMALMGLYQSWTLGLDHRITGRFGTYMTYSENLVTLGLALGAWLLFAPREGLSHPAGRVARGVVLLLMGAALVLTQTRGAWLGAFAGVATLVALRRARWLALLPLAAVAAFLLAPPASRARIEDLVAGRDVTSVERIYMWRAAAAMAADHPLTGVGPENFEPLVPGYRLPEDPWIRDRVLGHAHSNPMQIVAERGLPGLGTWLAIWVVWLGIVVRGWRALAPGDRVGRAALAGSTAVVVAFHVAGLTEYTWGDTEVMYVAYALMGVGLAYCPRSPRELAGRSPV